MCDIQYELIKQHRQDIVREIEHERLVETARQSDFSVPPLLSLLADWFNEAATALLQHRPGAVSQTTTLTSRHAHR